MALQALILILKNVKRINLKEEAMTKFVKTAFDNDININTELIIGLPGETWDSWTKGFVTYSVEILSLRCILVLYTKFRNERRWLKKNMV